MRPIQFVDCRCARAFVGSDETVSIERLCLSLLVSKNLNFMKVIKVSYLNQESCQCFACFSDSYAYEDYERFFTYPYISRINIWLCSNPGRD